MNWFERLTGFTETSYDETWRKLEVDRGQLRSLVNDRTYGIGTLELVSLQDLRERVQPRPDPYSRRLKVRLLTGDVRRLHASPDLAGALFQVASQFNLLEMISPEVTPEQGVTRYEHDGTQDRPVRWRPALRRYTATISHLSVEDKGRQVRVSSMDSPMWVPRWLRFLGNPSMTCGPCVMATPCVPAQGSRRSMPGTIYRRPSTSIGYAGCCVSGCIMTSR
jgi:hypothetical protein